MLYRLVRPMRREGSRNLQYVRRIPADVKERAAGLQLAVPLGERTIPITIAPGAQSVRLSLRTSNPATVKARSAAVDAYLENVWQALREDGPVSLSHRQATALGGELYHAWADGEGVGERTAAVEYDESTGRWKRVEDTHLGPDEWEAVRRHWETIADGSAPDVMEKALDPILDQLLLAKGILRVDAPSRGLVLDAAWQALRDAFESRERNAKGDYRPDPKAERFPQWQQPATAANGGGQGKLSLMGLVEEWWTEAKATGRKPSTYESHKHTIETFVAYLGHDDATQVTRDDVVGYKDARLASINPRNGKPLSPKTVKDSNLAGLKTVFSWAVANGKLPANAAEGVTLKLGRKPKLRSKGFTDKEAVAILTAALHHKQDREKPWTHAAKRWVPWLMAYTGARVGELVQLRKEDFRKEGRHWIITITPDAGTVKTNEARDVVLHPHLVELGFVDFVKEAPAGHLFLRPNPKTGDVRGPLRGIKNRLAAFARAVVNDPNVAPSHGWRHRFKTVGMEAGIDHRVLDGIQGQSPRTVAEGYGDVTVKTLARAIAKIPRYKVKGAERPAAAPPQKGSESLTKAR